MVLKIFLSAVDMSKYIGHSLLNDISSLEKSWHMFTHFFSSSANSCTCISVLLHIVFQIPWTTKQTLQLVSKCTESGLLFQGKVPSLHTHFYLFSSLTDVCSISYIGWFTSFRPRKPLLHCVFSKTALSTSEISTAFSPL